MNELEYWDEWDKHESQNYKISKGKKIYVKKGFLHFDDKYWYPQRKDRIKHILENKLLVTNPSNHRTEYWSFSPFLKLLIKTPRYKYQELEGHYDLETKIRPICFASHVDSLIYSYYAFSLSKKYEEYITKQSFSESVLAYRSNLNKCNIQFSKEVFDFVKHKQCCTAIALDIKGYFDHIDHLILKSKWCEVIGQTQLPEDQYRVYKSLTEYSYVTKSAFLKKFKGPRLRNETPFSNLMKMIPGNSPTEKYKKLRERNVIVTNNKLDKISNRKNGIPQGSAMSAVLSNLYLLDFDKKMYDKSISEGWTYRRYCDDILIICSTDKSNEIKSYVIDVIKNEFFLTIQDNKVETIDFKQNSKGIIRAFKRTISHKSNIITGQNERYLYKRLQYLGFEYDGQNTFVRNASLSRYFRKMVKKVEKVVKQAYSPHSKSNKIFVGQILEKYSHLGNRNFVSYSYNASKTKYKNKNGIEFEGLNSPVIKRQLSKHFLYIKRELIDNNNKRFQHKIKKKKNTVLKTINMK